MLSKKNILILIIFTIIVCAFQFFIARKHIYYGFTSDDWYLLAWYKQVVNNPILDMAKAWKEIGAHNFARVYYVGTLFKIFQYNFPLYHIFHVLLKALAGLSLFPVVYLLFKKRLFAYLATFLFSIHFSTFAILDGVYSSTVILVIVSMNLFLALYIWAAQKHNFSLKIMFILLILILTAAYFDMPRFYPVLMFLPFLELLNFWLNRSSTTLKSSILRLIFLYSPFIVLLLYFPSAASRDISNFGIYKVLHAFTTGNFQLFISFFASFGSTFVPEKIIGILSTFFKVGDYPLYHDIESFIEFLFFRFLVITPLALFILGSVTLTKPKKFILKSLLFSFIFTIIALFADNHWLFLDPKVQAAVDPGFYLIEGIVGLFVFSTSIAFFIEWLKKRDDYFLLTLSLAPTFSLIYTFFTWLNVGDSFIFLGVHNYLSIPALGSSLYLSIIFYLAIQNFRLKGGTIRKMAAILTVFYFFIFLLFSSIQVDNYYATWLKLGFGASDQKRYQDSFWKEVGKGQSLDKSPILVYLDTSADDGYYYGANFIWDIPSLLTIEKGYPLERGVYCKKVITKNDFNKMKLEEINGEKMIVQKACGFDLSYKLENFYAFKIINRQLVSIKSEIIKQKVVE